MQIFYSVAQKQSEHADIQHDTSEVVDIKDPHATILLVVNKFGCHFCRVAAQLLRELVDNSRIRLSLSQLNQCDANPNHIDITVKLTSRVVLLMGNMFSLNNLLILCTDAYPNRQEGEHCMQLLQSPAHGEFNWGCISGR